MADNCCAGFFIWETKPLTIEFEPEGVLDDVEKVVVSIAQPMFGVNLEKRGSEVIVDAENNQVDIYLTQEETSIFSPGEAVIQVNFLYDDEERDTSVQGIIKVWDNLHREVMT